MDRTEQSQRDIERAVGCSFGMVSRWMRGVVEIESKYRNRLEDLARVPTRSWDEPPLAWRIPPPRKSEPRPRARAKKAG